ncbi:MAG: DNRLRE domain-containing protein [Flaviramulus sp.]|nr:LamG-like jellyroll fold domain-containing protein [Flaviramulus sp.]NNC49866.1 DNRLRE domain-containing protein [Flaviramulus sp.]
MIRVLLSQADSFVKKTVGTNHHLTYIFKNNNSSSEFIFKKKQELKTYTKSLNNKKLAPLQFFVFCIVLSLISFKSYAQTQVTCDFIATQDTYIKKKEASNNYGDCELLTIDREGGDLHRALFQFDLSGIPATSTIISSQLRLYTENGNGMNVSVYQIGATDAWDEGSSCDGNGVSNWNVRQGTSNWSTSGVVGPSDGGSPLATIDGGSDGIHSWPLTALTQGWFNGTITNNGVMVGSPDGGGDRTIDYDSRETTTGIPPVLRVTYTIDNIDSDGDGIYDSVDIDNDNDGIHNLNESMAEDSGHDGSYSETSISFGISSNDYDDEKESHFLNTITLNGTTYSDFIVPDAFEGDFPTVNNDQKVYLSDHTNKSFDYFENPSFPDQILPAFQSRNLNYYLGIDGANFLTSSYTLSYSNPIYSTGNINVAIAERNGNNPYFIEALDAYGNVLGNITVNLSDYIDTGYRVNKFQSGGMFLAFFPVDDLAPIGAPISALRITFPNATNDGPDGKVFFFGDLSVMNNDTDQDGIPNDYDLDSDNDGIPDIVETGLGNISSGTGTIPLSVFVDINSNGMHDAFESSAVLDSDGDGVPNFLDLDSDNDTVFDVDEARTERYVFSTLTFENGDGDINGDGVGDGTESETSRIRIIPGGCTELFGDGILDIYDYGTGANEYGNLSQGSAPHYVADSDDDGTPDYIDITSNGTDFDIALTHYPELDSNNDGVIDDTNDNDNDGVVDLFDTNDSSFGSPRDLQKKLDLYFDGRNDYVEDSSLINEWGEATIMAWIRIDPSATGDQKIFGQNSFNLQLNTDKSISVMVNRTILSNNAAINTNQWTHVAATYSENNQKLILYINGREANNLDVTGPLPADNSNLTIGRQSNNSIKFFNGFIDEVRLFSKALAKNELQKIVYQELENNAGITKGSAVPTNVNNYIDKATNHQLGWSNLQRYYNMDTYKDNVLDDLTTTNIDEGSGARIYNVKIIGEQTAPLPFVTKQGGRLEVAINDPERGINGADAINPSAIVKILHNDVYIDTDLHQVGLIIAAEDAESNPIEFKVKNDSELNVSWYLKLDGKIDLEGESQLIQGEGSYLDPASSGTLEKDQQGTADTYTYNYWSMPVGVSNNTTNNNGYTLQDVFTDINFLTTGYNGTATPVGIADYWIWKYCNSPYNSYASWQHVRSTGTLLPGEGFTMKGPGSGSISTPQNYVLEGKPNNGDINLPINAGNEYLVGNPYASALDAHQFILDNGATIGGTGATTGTLYFWEHWGGGSHNLSAYQGGYATYSLAGGIPAAAMGTNDPSVGTGGQPTKIPGRYIPVGQGFFVNAEADGMVNFNNGQRVFQVEDGTNSVFTKSTNTKKNKSANKKVESTDKRTKLRIGFNSVNTIRRQLLITVDSTTTSGYDWGYDAPYLDYQIDDMYWMIDQNKYSIQGIDNLDNTSILPLGIHTKNNGVNSISLDKLENNNEELNVYLHDKAFDIYHNLNEGNYDVELYAGEYLDRFEIAFSQGQALDVNDNYDKPILAYYSNEKNSIIIQNSNSRMIESIEMFNILGQSLFQIDIDTIQKHLEYNVSPIKTGAYIIKMTTENGIVSKKVLVE